MSTRAQPPYLYEGETLHLTLQVQPSAKHSGWAGMHGTQALRLRIAAPALDDRANQACLRFLAKSAGVPLSAVHLLRGKQSRQKHIRIDSVNRASFEALREQWAQ